MTNDQMLAWREGMGWTQDSAAEALGVTRATYQRMERGEDWKTGKAVVIDRRTELACAAISAGIKLL